jgi:transposase-like protein
MATVKTVNYTPEQTAAVVEAYKAGEAVEAIAEAFGRSTRSITAKLAREGVYVAKAKNEGRVKKEVLVANIAKAIGVDEEVLDSLEKATAQALTLVAEALNAR